MATILSYTVIFFFKQKTAYEMRISDWSSDVCSSDLVGQRRMWLDRVPRLAMALLHPRFALADSRSSGGASFTLRRVQFGYLGQPWLAVAAGKNSRAAGKIGRAHV